MGYFPNGDSGMYYHEQYCSRCLHDRAARIDPDSGGGCQVWLAHLAYNYGQEKNPDLKHTLELLIPRTASGIGNEQCTMFVEDPDLPDPRQIDLFEMAER